MSEHASHAWTVLCKRSSVDLTSGSVTLVDVLEELTFEGVSVPEGATGIFLPLDAELVSLWSRVDINQPARVEGRVRLVTPRGGPVGKVRFDVDLGEKHFVHHRMRFHILPFEGPGLYWFQVEEKEGEEWKRVAQLPLKISSANGREAATPTAE